MARLPPNIVLRFAQALKSFEASESTFRVLCSLSPSSASASSAAAPEFAPPEPPQQPAKYILVLDSSFNPPTLAHHRMVISALKDPRYRTKGPHNTDEARDKEAAKPQGMSETSAASRVLLLLAINNADKAPKPAAFPQRLSMMYAFAQGILAEAAAEENQTQNQEGLDRTSTSIGCEAVDIAITTEPYFHAKAQSIAISDFYNGLNDTAADSDSAVSMDNAAESEQVYLTGYDTLIRIFDPKYYTAKSMRASLDPFFAYAILRVTMRTDDSWGDAVAQMKYLEELRGGKLEDVGGRKEWVDRIEMVQGRKGDEAIISSTKVRDAVRDEDWEALGGLVGQDVVGWIRENGLYAGGEA
ncbi:hypothetical protein F4808DRAFT_420641 [Astrocystis sublimbata]|nr:hypothetical protein F4808DRAFT_420641 [Astrocystis sublimbata]